MAPPKSEQEELRELQRKAYGRDGGLTDADALRLRDLERAVVAVPLTSPEAVLPDAPSTIERSTVDGATGVEDVGLTGQSVGADSATRSDEGAEVSHERAEDARGPAGRLRTILRTQWRVLTVAAVVLLAIGIGAGWALFGARSDDIPLTEAQQQRKLELYEKGGYDEGSVRAIGQDDDALVWYGTRNDGENVCLVLDVGEATGQTCQRSDDLDADIFGLSAMTIVPGEGDSPSTSVMAYLMYSTSDVPLVSIQRWEQSSGVVEQFTGEDRARAEELTGGDEAMNLTIVGYFRDEPVWLMDRWNGNSMETCLIVDGAEGQSSCRPNEDAISDGIAVYVSDDAVVPGEEVEASTVWSLEVDYTLSGTPYLTIVRDPEAVKLYFDGSESFDGSKIELGGEYGDPIEVVPPTTDSKG